MSVASSNKSLPSLASLDNSDEIETSNEILDEEVGWHAIKSIVANISM